MFAHILRGVALTEIHMRKVLLLAVGLALVGTSAWSQSSSRDDDDRRDRWHDDYDRWDRGEREERHGRAMREDDDRSGRNARFFLRSGDTELRVVCGERESTQACVDSALRIYERVQSQSRATTGSPVPPAPQ
jgi:hypothetical protein